MLQEESNMADVMRQGSKEGAVVTGRATARRTCNSLAATRMFLDFELTFNNTSYHLGLNGNSERWCNRS
jgi:hypothetical protein